MIDAAAHRFALPTGSVLPPARHVRRRKVNSSEQSSRQFYFS